MGGDYRMPTEARGPLVPEPDRFLINERVYVVPDGDAAPAVLRGRAGRVLADFGDAERVELLLTDFGPVSAPRGAVRRERRGTWQPPWTYAEALLPGDDPLGPPRIVPTA